MFPNKYILNMLGLYRIQIQQYLTEQYVTSSSDHIRIEREKEKEREREREREKREREVEWRVLKMFFFCLINECFYNELRRILKTEDHIFA